MELFLSLFFVISGAIVFNLLHLGCFASLTDAISLNIIKLRRGENTGISEVFDVKSLEVGACPHNEMTPRHGDIETKRYTKQPSRRSPSFSDLIGESSTSPYLRIQFVDQTHSAIRNSKSKHPEAIA